MGRWLLWGVIAALLLLGVGLRFADLNADPPFGLSSSAGIYFDGISTAHSARSYVLFGEMRPDEWDGFLYSPIMTLVQIPWFKCLGTSLSEINGFAATCSLLTLLCAVLLLKRLSWVAALLGALFFSTEYLLVQMGRVGLVENPVIVCMMLAALAMQARKRVLFWTGMAGFLAMLAFITKAIVPYYPLAVLIGVGFRAWRDGDEQGRVMRTLLLRGGCYALGLALATLPWLLFFRLPYAEAIEAFGGQWIRSTFPQTLGDALSTSTRTFIFFNMGKIQNLWLLAIPITVVVAGRFFRRPRELDPLGVLLTAWFVGGCLFISLLKATPVRYVYTLLPALYGLLAYGLHELIKTKRFSLPKQWSTLLTDVAAVIGLTVILRYFVHYRISFGPILCGYLPKIWELLLLSFLMAAALWLAFRLVLRLLKRREIPLPLVLRVLFVLAVVGHFTKQNAVATRNWWKTRRHTIVQTSRALGERYPQMVIGGTAACAAVVENRGQAIRVCKPKWCNYDNPIGRFGMTHTFITDYAGEASRWQGLYAEHMTNAVLRETVEVCGYPFKIFEFQ